MVGLLGVIPYVVVAVDGNAPRINDALAAIKRWLNCLVRPHHRNVAAGMPLHKLKQADPRLGFFVVL